MQMPLRLLTATQRRKRLYPTIATIFRAHDLYPSWGLAFAYVESNFRPWVVTNSGGDGKRGGAWGLFQMTFLTARGLGFMGIANELLDLHLNTRLAAKLIYQNKSNYGDLENIAARYNSGKIYILSPQSTREYCKRIIEKQAYYAGIGADEFTAPKPAA